MKSIWTYISIFVLGFFACYLFLTKASCNQSKQFSIDKEFVDSLNKKHVLDSLHFQAKIDYWKDSAITYKQKIDTLTKIVKLYGLKLDARSKNIQNLLVRIHKMEAEVDTVGVFDLVDSLTNEIMVGITQLNEYRTQRDSLDSSYKGLISIKDSLIKSQDSTINSLNNFSFNLQLEVQKLQETILKSNTEIIKLSKLSKSNKRLLLLSAALNVIQGSLNTLKK